MLSAWAVSTAFYFVVVWGGDAEMPSQWAEHGPFATQTECRDFQAYHRVGGYTTASECYIREIDFIF